MTEPLEEMWAEEGGIRVRLCAATTGVRIEIIDISSGWNEKATVLASATVVGFRCPRVAEVFRSRGPSHG